MASARDTIIIRVKSATKWAARRAAKADKVTLTDYIINLIHRDNTERNGVTGKWEPDARKTEEGR
jgi:uncharacterized protein (DUF1778 family)